VTHLTALAAEFPGYSFGILRTWNGISLSAQDIGRAAEPGLYSVITSDPDEMREALRSGVRLCLLTPGRSARSRIPAER
jgi:hypothetical protein